MFEKTFKHGLSRGGIRPPSQVLQSFLAVRPIDDFRERVFFGGVGVYVYTRRAIVANGTALTTQGCRIHVEDESQIHQR